MSTANAFLISFNGQPQAIDPKGLKISDDSARLTQLHDRLIENGVFDARIGGFTEKGVVVFGSQDLLKISNAVAETGFISNSNSTPDVMRDFDRAANVVTMMPKRANVMGGFGGYTPMAA